MTGTVRIMPKEPIEAGVMLGGDQYRLFLNGRDDITGFGVPVDKWHEVSEPITWDGTEGSFAVIQRALGEIGLTVEADGGNDMTWHILVIRGGGDPGWTGRELGNVSLHARIRVEGDSFVILPPEVES